MTAIIHPSTTGGD